MEKKMELKCRKKTKPNQTNTRKGRIKAADSPEQKGEEQKQQKTGKPPITFSAENEYFWRKITILLLQNFKAKSKQRSLNG